MTDMTNFPIAMRGYDKKMVDEHVRTLTDMSRTHREQADHLRLRVSALEEALENMERQAGGAAPMPVAPAQVKVISDDSAAQEELERMGQELADARRDADQMRGDLEFRNEESARLMQELAQAREAAVAAEERAAAAASAEGSAPMAFSSPAPQGAMSLPDDSVFEKLGARIGQILRLAEEEADTLRQSAEGDIKEARSRAEEKSQRLHEEADAYAEDRRQAAELEAARAMEEARRGADEMMDSAERDATARREEAEALYEQQRARAAQAAADFEMTLAQRRERAEQDFSGRSAAAEAQIASLVEQGEAQRIENERARSDAERTVQRLISDANSQAQELVATAKARADKIRAESERELAAAAQRRDSINAQLTNVRQMLATLSGTAITDDPFRALATEAAAAASDQQVDVTEAAATEETEPAKEDTA